MAASAYVLCVGRFMCSPSNTIHDAVTEDVDDLNEAEDQLEEDRDEPPRRRSALLSAGRGRVVGGSILLVAVMALCTILFRGPSSATTMTVPYEAPSAAYVTESEEVLPAVTPPTPWYKLDFVVPACQTCSCGPFNVDRAIQASQSEASGVAEAYGVGDIFLGKQLTIYLPIEVLTV